MRVVAANAQTKNENTCNKVITTAQTSETTQKLKGKSIFKFLNNKIIKLTDIS